MEKIRFNNRQDLIQSLMNGTELRVKIPGTDYYTYYFYDEDEVNPFRVYNSHSISRENSAPISKFQVDIQYEVSGVVKEYNNKEYPQCWFKVLFTSLNEGTVIESEDETRPVGHFSDQWISHTCTDNWK